MAHHLQKRSNRKKLFYTKNKPRTILRIPTETDRDIPCKRNQQQMWYNSSMVPPPFSFTTTHRDTQTHARTGVFTTPHCDLYTPELAIVATDGHVKALSPAILSSLRLPYLIVNTFHIHTKKIALTIKAQGGIHQHMHCPHSAIASDSGGFQIFSLGFGKVHGVGKVGSIFPGHAGHDQDTHNPLTITSDGATFTYDGRSITLTPESSMDIQHRIGADIIFAFDECTSALNSKEYTEHSLEKSNKWLERCVTHHANNMDPSKPQALFGIVQGGAYHDLRIRAATFVGKQPVPGFGIGGSLGKNKDEMRAILDWTIPLLPDTKPRHLLGIGQVRDIFEGVERGIDLFDCVIPTREARHKIIYTKKGKMSVRKLKNEDVLINPHCYPIDDAPTLTWKQLAALFSDKDPRAYMYATLHNISFYTNLMREIRESIATNTLHELKEAYLRYY